MSDIGLSRLQSALSRWKASLTMYRIMIWLMLAMQGLPLLTPLHITPCYDLVVDSATGYYRLDPETQERQHIRFGYSMIAFPQWSPDGTQVAFFKERANGSFSLLVSAADDSEVRQLAEWVNTSSDPVWSPDQHFIAFIKNEQVFLADMQTYELRQITNDEQSYYLGFWSPDGNKLLFASGTRFGYTNFIAIWDKVIGEIKKISVWEPRQIILLGGWSPDGSKFAFIDRNTYDLSGTLFVYNLDTQSLQAVTSKEDGIYDYFVSWLPDSKSLLFSTNRGHESGLYQVDWNGENAYLITTQYPLGISWSPDRQQFVFIGTEPTPRPNTTITNLFVVDLPTRKVNQITEDGQLALNSRFIQPQWSPTGNKIAFSAWVNGNSEIFIINGDGSDLQRLTHNALDDFDPIWIPCIAS